MPSFHLITAVHPEALLLAAADGFLARSAASRDDPFPTPPYLLVLRQGGLRDDLFALAAARGVPGWFDPPLAVFHELPRWLGATDRRPLGEFERVALLEHLLRHEGGPIFRGRAGAFLSAVDRFFGELVVEDVAPEALERAAAPGAGREPYQLARDRTLAALYRAYTEVLAAGGLRDGRDSLADAARAVRDDPAALAGRLGGRREIRILGLADLRGGWLLLLRALAGVPALDHVRIYATAPLALPDDLRASVEALPSPVVAASPGAAASALPRVDTVTVIAERHEDAELAAVAARVRRLLEEGVAPSEIAVIARDGRPYLELAVRALERAGVPATARLRTALDEVPVIRAVLALLGAAARGWTRETLADLGSQPYFASDLDVRIINYLGFRRRIAGLADWQAALDALLAEAQAAEREPGEEGETRSATLPAAWVERARERFAAFAATAALLDAPRPLGEWLAWLADWLSRDPWRIEARLSRVPADRWDVLRLDLLGWRHLRAVVDEWRAARARWPGDQHPVSAAVFVERLRAILAGDVALHTPTRRGVQVLEALAASHRTFDHVFLVGLNAGAFPKRPPVSLLLDEDDREYFRAKGLPLEVSAEWEAREQTLFATLAAGARRSLTASYVALDDLGGAANPSVFLDAWPVRHREVAPPESGAPVCRSAALAAHAERVARIERVRATGELSPWNGLVEEPDALQWLAARFGSDHVWSPTRLEAYAKCPWAFFSERLLHLAALEDPDADMDHRVRGTVLHDALRLFYDGARARTGGPVFLEPKDAAWAVPLLREAIRAALDRAGTTLWLGHPALREVKYRELERLLERYLEFEMEENRKGSGGRGVAGSSVLTAVEAHELAFETLELERDGTKIRYRGIVDRIEAGVDPRAPGTWVAAVDYKTTKYSAPAAGDRAGWSDRVVLQVPLYAHALRVLRPGARVARVEYRAIKQAARLHRLSLVRVRRTVVTDDPEAEARMEDALRAAVRHVSRIVTGEFPAAPAPSCGCPPFCHAWDICRVAGGPRTGRDV